jgi:hypothetical protein
LNTFRTLRKYFIHKLNMDKHQCWKDSHYSPLCKINQLILYASFHADEKSHDWSRVWQKKSAAEVPF